MIDTNVFSNLEKAIDNMSKTFNEFYEGLPTYMAVENLSEKDGEKMREAIKALEQQPCEEYNYKALWEQVKWERDVAIEQLEQLGYSLGEKIRTSEDCISRQYLIEKATSWDKHFADSERYVSLTDIQNAPPVTPQPKRGKWIKANGEENLAIWTCDQCGCKIYSETEYDRKKFHAWCGKCGCKMDADMREVQDGR